MSGENIPLENPPLSEEERQEIFQCIKDLSSPATREAAMILISQKRESIPDLAPMLWGSFGCTAALLQEVVDIYPSIFPPTLTFTQASRVSYALSLLQCVAAHPETKKEFMASRIPFFLFPFLHTTSASKAFEYLRLTSLSVLGAFLKFPERETAAFLLETEIIPVCLRIMENGEELSKTLAAFILQRIIFLEDGLAYVCSTFERFSHVAVILGKMIFELAKEPSARMLKQLVYCYLGLTNNGRALEVLRYCLPDPLRDSTFSACLGDDEVTKNAISILMERIQMEPSPSVTPTNASPTDVTPTDSNNPDQI